MIREVSHVWIGIRCNSTASKYMQLSSVMSRAADSHTEKTGFKTRPDLFF